MSSPRDPRWCALIRAHPAPPPEPPRQPTPPAARFRPLQVPKEHACEICGTVMYDHNCKIVCPNCGYRRDCSDP